MSRTIKFRGKRCSDDEWVYGQYAEANRGWTIKGHFREPHKSWIICSALSNGGFFNLMERYAVKDDTVCQFTGLYDKDGKEIYEGDIVKEIGGRIGYISWLPQECGFVVVWKKSDSRLGHRARGSGYNYDSTLMVIGNKIDNPELIK